MDRITPRLSGRSILIAEDEALIAWDIAAEFEEAGARIVGPVSRVADAASICETDPPDAAILDMNLSDGDADAIVEGLVRQGVPVVISTGALLPLSLSARHPDVPVFAKPALPEELTDAVARQLV